MSKANNSLLWLQPLCCYLEPHNHFISLYAYFQVVAVADLWLITVSFGQLTRICCLRNVTGGLLKVMAFWETFTFMPGVSGDQYHFLV